MTDKAEKLRGRQVAERLGIGSATWRSYVARGQAPPPDGHFDQRSPFWYAATVDAYDVARQGRGWWRDDPDEQRRPARRRRTFTPEFKAEIVAMCERGDQSVGEIAREHDLAVSVVRTWVRQAESDRN